MLQNLMLTSVSSLKEMNLSIDYIKSPDSFHQNIDVVAFVLNNKINSNEKR